ncbi:MAG: helix-turn-helix transcriptional regulator [Polyangiaceae bacterium]|nr:helix-turn-helix transcriptional regulator [Polyangiaceae bacterium]
MARSAAASKGPRPAQGARLLALRRAAGLTQVELAKALGVSNANIAFWEWSAKPPRSDVLPALARALRVRVEDLLLEQAVARTPPNSKLQRTFEKGPLPSAPAPGPRRAFRRHPPRAAQESQLSSSVLPSLL